MSSGVINFGIFRTYVILKATEPDEITQKREKEPPGKLENITHDCYAITFV